MRFSPAATSHWSLRPWCLVAGVLALLASGAFVGAQPAAAALGPSRSVGAPSVTVPPPGSTIGIPGPFAGVFGTFEGPHFPISWTCPEEVWDLTIGSTGRIDLRGGATSNVTEQFSPDVHLTTFLIFGARTDMPDTSTVSGTLNCFVTGVGRVAVPFSTTVNYVEGPEAVTPPGGASTPPPAQGCPAAAGFLAAARFWNGLAQSYRGRSVEAGRLVIDYANKGFDAYSTALGKFFIDLAPTAVADKTQELLLEKEIEGIRQVFLATPGDFDRQIERLRGLRKYFKALGPIGEIEMGLAIGEGLYYLGLAAQQGVRRDIFDAQADDALARANEQQRLAKTACGGKATAELHEVTMRTAAKAPLYTKLPKSTPVRGFRVAAGLGMSARVAGKLNALLAGQERVTALAHVVSDSTSRSRAAARAGRKDWQARQLKHARATARTLATLVDKQARLREQLGASLVGRATQSQRLEITDPKGLSAALRRLGLPGLVRVTLRRLGRPPGPFLRAFTRVRPAELAAPPLRDAVGDPAGVASDRAWAADLRRFAAGP